MRRLAISERNFVGRKLRFEILAYETTFMLAPSGRCSSDAADLEHLIAHTEGASIESPFHKLVFRNGVSCQRNCVQILQPPH